MTADELASAVTAEAAHELTCAHDRIKHCLAQLNDEQIWSRSTAEMNSVGNLVLHLCGNMRQWLVAGLGGGADLRNRPAEFAERGPIEREQLLRKLELAVEEAKATMTRQNAEQLAASRRIQSFPVTGLGAIFGSVPH